MVSYLDVIFRKAKNLGLSIIVEHHSLIVLKTGGARQHPDQMFKFSYLEDRHALLILQQQKIGPFEIFLIDWQ